MVDPVRISLAIPNESRDATRAKDSWAKNCFLEQGGTALRAVGRPGTVLLGNTPGALGSGVWNYNDLIYHITSGDLYQTLPSGGGISAGAPIVLTGGGSCTPVGWDGTIYGAAKDVIPTVFCTSSDGITYTPGTTPSGVVYQFATHGGVWYAGVDSGGTTLIYSSSNHGSTWSHISTLPVSYVNFVFSSTEVYALSGPTNAIVVYVSSDGGATWAAPYTVDLTNRGRLAYLSGAFYTYNVSTKTLEKSTDGLHTFSAVSAPFNGVSYYECASNSSFLYALSYVSQQVWWTLDGVNFSLLSAYVPASTAWWFPNATGLLLTDYFTVWFITQGGVSLNLGTVVSSPFFDFLDIDPASGASGFVFKSTTNAYQYNTGTGTLSHVTDGDYPATTVAGLAFLDGTYYVMDALGRIWGSDINNFLSWNALNVIEAQMEPDGGVAIARQLNFIVAFGQYSTEFFYDAGNPTGSPLLPYTSAVLTIGCAAGRSVVQIENQLYFVGQSKQKGRGVYMIEGTTPKALSTPAIERILNADDLATVHACGIRISGHNFYVLTLVTSAITLVLDILTGDWKEWTSLTLGTPVTGKTATYANGQVTVASTAHGLTDGAIVRVSAGTDTAFNGDVLAMYVDANTWAYVPAIAPTHSSNTVTYTPFTESYFFGVNYTGFAAYDVFQDGAGNLYTASADLHTDSGYPIDVDLRTPTMDGGEALYKFQPRGQIIGDTIPSTLYMRYSNDDYQTWSSYRPISMSQQRKLLNRQGRFRRRAYEVKHIADQLVRLEAIELTVERGAS